MIARKLVLGCLLLVAGLYVLCGAGIFMLRWINPWTTSVQIERRLQAIYEHQPYTKRYHFVLLSNISPGLQQAVVAAEDGRFRQHHGFDWTAMRDVFEVSIQRRRFGPGGSTITQQLVKNLFLTTAGSFVRKGAEFALAPLAEAFLTKDRILELYLNVIEWGPGIYGAEAASESYYRLPASSLSREQAARLAAVIPAPLKRMPEQMNQSSTEILYRMEQADFLEMADDLLERGYKEAAAMMVGFVLEAHLRKLALKSSPPMLQSGEALKKAGTINSELGAAAVYSKLDQETVTAGLDLSDKAAHGKDAEYNPEQVSAALRWLRDFLVRHPA